MIRDEFEILAAKVLADEATPDDIARLKAMLVENPDLEGEYEELRATWSALAEAGPVAEAMQAPQESPPVDRVKEWEAALTGRRSRAATVTPQSKRFASRMLADLSISRWQIAIAASVIIAVVLGVLLGPKSQSLPGEAVAYLVSHQGSARIANGGKIVAAGSATSLSSTDKVEMSDGAAVTLICRNGAFSLKGPLKFGADYCSHEKNASGADAVQTALFQPLQAMTALLIITRSSHGIRVYSPAGYTTNSTPTILWKSEVGKTYDISIKDELIADTPPLLRSGVVSPLEFATAWPNRALAQDGLYRLTVFETGQPLTATELTFRKVPATSVEGASHANRVGGASSTSPTHQLLAAYNILSTTPSHVGDALTALLTLPPDLADSDMALRLKLFAFGQIGCHEDFEATLSQLRR